MVRRICAALTLTLAVGGSLPAHGQVRQATVYHADNQNGSVIIFAENHGFVPYTVTLQAQLTRMHCTDTLPTRFVVFPSKLPKMLTTFTYTPGDIYQFHYYVASQYGIYTSHAPDSSYVYGLPFPNSTVAEQRFFNTKFRRKMHHHYFFNLPKDTPVRAAREGIVAEVRQDLPFAKGDNSNYFVIFHDDGTYAEYTNFNQNSAAFQPGQRVAKGDILCYASGQKRHWFRFSVQYPGATGAREAPVIFDSRN